MKYTNKYNLPQSIFDAISNDTYDLKKDPNIISVTTLINPPKIRLLRQRHDVEIEEDITENIWSLLGSAVHEVLGRVDDKNRLIEERINIPVNGKVVSGKSDIYEITEKCIQDYKVTSAWSIVFSPEGKKEWIEQLNVYAWLYRQLGFDVERLRIVAILRDWSKTKAQADSDYPQLQIKVIEIPLWSFDQQDMYVVDRVSLHQLFEPKEDDLIPCCTPEERWATADTWAIYKNGNKRAVKVCDTEEEASRLITEFDQKQTWRIEHRRGEDKRCKDYCSVNQFCNYYKENYVEV